MKDLETKIQDKVVIFTLKKPSREPGETYTVKMSNNSGVAQKDVKLNMQDKPQPPQDLDVSC